MSLNQALVFYLRVRIEEKTNKIITCRIPGKGKKAPFSGLPIFKEGRNTCII
jgi:hypothetical protein